MEVVYLLLVCCVVHTSQGISYYYPPVYGKAEDVDYARVKTNLKQAKPQGVSYYYPPVYGKEEDVEQTSSDQQGRQESEEAVYHDEKPSYRRRHRGRTIYYKRPSYAKPKPAQTSEVREERQYVEEEESVEEDYYKRPEKKSYPKKKTTRKCLQCEYSPPKPIHYEVLVREPHKVQVPRQIEECQFEKNIEYVYVKPRKGSKQIYGRYKEVPKYQKTCFPKTIYETKTVYRTRYVKKQKLGQSGGFEACRGPLNAYTAKKYGVDDWDCHNNCYVKQDKTGTITRGCYSGQYKVDPNRLGCHYQGDSKQDLYCFCQGDHCNGKSVPTQNSYSK